jgi:hypothetical protein
MEPITRTELQELYPEQQRRQRERQIEKMTEDIYKTVKRLAQAGFFSYKHTTFADEKELLPFVIKELQKVFLGIDISLTSTYYKDPRIQRMVEVKDSAIFIDWS